MEETLPDEVVLSVIDQARTSKELPLKEAIHIQLNPSCLDAALKSTGSRIRITPRSNS